MTLDDARAQLTLWINANSAVAEGQSVSVGDMILTRADLAKIEAQIQSWTRRVNYMQAAANGVKRPGFRRGVFG